MYYKYHKRKFPDDVLVYIEEYNKADSYVIFDFYDSNELDIFSSYLTINTNLNLPTMVRMENYNLRTIRENTYYSINRQTIVSWAENNLITQNETSFLIGYSIDLSNFDSILEVFTHSVSLNDDSNFSHFFRGNRDVSDIDFGLAGKLNVVVRNVGQGNWNEIVSDDSYEVVYDCGTTMFANKSDVRKLINSRAKAYINSKPTLFISHWDKDHYHCLIGMTDDELLSFSNIVFRDYLPNLTCRNLIGRIKRLFAFKNIYSIPAETRTSRGGFTSLKPLNDTTNQLVIYNSQYHKDRNISGILLSLKTAGSSVVFSGDSHYLQVSKCILPHLNYTHKHYLIVPHHGGKGGSYVYDNPGKIQYEEAIISVGKNRYGHPLSHYVTSLKTDFTNVKKTSLAKRDIIITL
ncbi:MAG: hypothetical protein ACTHOM_01515 [Allomuricauda sp.]